MSSAVCRPLVIFNISVANSVDAGSNLFACMLKLVCGVMCVSRRQTRQTQTTLVYALIRSRRMVKLSGSLIILLLFKRFFVLINDIPINV